MISFSSCCFVHHESGKKCVLIGLCCMVEIALVWKGKLHSNRVGEGSSVTYPRDRGCTWMSPGRSVCLPREIWPLVCGCASLKEISHLSWEMSAEHTDQDGSAVVDDHVSHRRCGYIAVPRNM
jgi:hypothetical protein